MTADKLQFLITTFLDVTKDDLENYLSKIIDKVDSLDKLCSE